MRQLEFLKMHVCGNDFVVCDWLDGARAPRPVWHALARQVCERRKGIGGDELVLLLPSSTHDLTLCVLNPDGSEAPMCGNAVLAASRLFADRRGLRDCSLTLELPSGSRRAWVDAEGCSGVDMGVPTLRSVGTGFEPLSVDGIPLRARHLDTGTSHAVVLVEDLATFPVSTLGPLLERHPRFGGSTNVMFVQPLGPGALRMRPWERGGTGESLACGSGACAAAFAAAGLEASAPRHYRIQCPGGELEVALTDSGRLVLKGLAQYTFRGHWSPDAARHGID
jgi:diaminopimelate epimerase